MYRACRPCLRLCPSPLGTRVVSLASSRLKPMVDPLMQVLGQLHKVRIGLAGCTGLGFWCL